MKDRLPGYLERIRHVFPDLPVSEAVLNEEGLVNDVVILNGRLVCRFGKQSWARADLQQEYRCLTLAHHHFAPLVKDPSFMAGEQTFMHGDLASYHLLFDPAAKRLNGVIDFGTAGIGDPACDLALILEDFGESFLRYLDPYYPEIGTLIERARFWAGSLELEWLLGGLRDAGDPSWFAVHIGRARDVLPIGCGW